MDKNGVLVLQGNQRIHIIHMNDLHSHFDNMKKITTYIKKTRAELEQKDDKLIIVDLGDHMDRMRIETEGTSGLSNVEILNLWQTDVITIGNNEGLTFTKDKLSKAYQTGNFKIVACNMLDADTNRLPQWLNEYWIQTVNGIRIAWIGATAPYEIFYRLQGWIVENPISKIREIVNEIRDQADIIILMSHLGIRADKKIAEEIDAIDVILGAHTHRLFENGIKNENQPLICQVGIFGEKIGHLTIDYNFNKQEIDLIQENTISMEHFAEDIETRALINKNKIIAKEVLSEPVARLTHPLSISIDAESPLANLLADGIKKWVDAEISFVNAGQLLEGLEEGIVTKEKIHEICPSPINACKVTLSGKQIKLTLEQSLLDEFKYSNAKGYGFRGKQLGSLSISGMNVWYNMVNPSNYKIEKILINGEILKEEKEYSVGTLDMFTFGGGYYLIKEGKNIQYFLPEFIRDILEQQLVNETSILESFSNRWFEIKN